MQATEKSRFSKKVSTLWTDTNYTRACYLEGTVTDSVTGLPISNAFVEVLTTMNNDSSNIDGIYKTGAAVAGTYTVNVIADNYFGKAINNVVLNNGVLTSLNVQLLPLNASVKELNANIKLNVFPNPVTISSQVELPETLAAKKDLDFVVYNTLGNKILYKKVNSKYISINKNDFNAGYYFFEIKENQSIKARGRFVVQ